MTESVEGFITTKQAAALTGYTKDYVGQLAREGYIGSKKVGRNRMVKVEDLFLYIQEKNEASQNSATSENETEPKTEEIKSHIEPKQKTSLSESKSTIEINKIKPAEEVVVESDKSNQVVEKKIISPWVKEPATTNPTSYSSKSVSSKLVTESSEQSNFRNSEDSTTSPVITSNLLLPAATLTLGLVFMFLAGSLVFVESQESNGTNYSLANIESLDISDQIAIGWKQMVDNFINN